MELKNILDEKSSKIDDYSFDAASIKKTIREKSLKDIKYIVGFHRAAIIFNAALMVFFVLILLLLQNWDLIFPILLISLSFALIIYDTMKFLKQSKKIDRTASVKVFLHNQLEIIEGLEKRNRTRLPMVSMMGFVGGFLSSLIINGWTFTRIIETPLVLVFLALLGLLYYFFIKKTSFSGLNKLLAKTYRKKKGLLEENLKILNEME